MSNPQNEIKQLSDNDIKQLINEIINNPQNYPQEAKFILQLSEWRRPGPSFNDYGKIQVLLGEAEFIELYRIYNYPTTDITKYAILPKTLPVVLLFEYGDDYEGSMVRHAELYAFTTDGWVKVQLY